MPTQLSQVKLDEVSLVDAGAAQHSKILLIKRKSQHPDGTECKGDACDAMMGGAPCKGKHCATIEKAPAGIQFVIGFKEEGGSEVQSVIFDSKLWDADKAKAWLKDHDMVSEKKDVTENTLRFRQADPKDFTRFRVIKPGAQVSKALRAKDSWQRMQGAVERAVREKFGDKPKAGDMMASMPMGVWVRDFFEDSVVFDKDGGIFRTDYEIDYNADGEPQVMLGDAVPVEVVYQDIKKVGALPPPELVLDGVPEELQSRVLKLRMDLLRAKLRKSALCPAAG